MFNNSWLTRVALVVLVTCCFLAAKAPTTGEDSQGAAKARITTENRRVQQVSRTYEIHMPDFSDNSKEQPWRDSSNDVYRKLQQIADEILSEVANADLSIEKRLFALSVATQFDIFLTGPKLVAVVNFRDDRARTSAPMKLGEFPIVIVLADSGSAGVRCIVDALETETDVEKRRLLGDALEQGAGLDFAEKAIASRLGRVEMEDAQREKLTRALEEIRKRQQRATEVTSSSP